MKDNSHIRDEAFYHFVWQHKLYRTDNIETVCGLPIEVIHPGLLNHDAGPDFFNAKIKIDGVLWAGNVELHTKSSDWNLHRHQHNKAYDNVILHVVASYSSPVQNTLGNDIPTLVMDINPPVFQQYDKLILEKKTIACSSILPQIDSLFLLNYRDRLVVERLQRKSIQIDSILENTKGDWETIFFQTICRNFGFGVNADVFERLGKSLSYKLIAKHRDNIVQLEALLFGQAGFLEEKLEDTYYCSLQREYKFLKTKYQLKPLDKHLWKFLRLRPSNFPTIRLAELAHLLHQHDSLLHQIIDSEDKAIEKLFSASTSLYWETHYQFGKLSNKRKKTLGKSAINTIIINTVAPILFCYGKSKGLTQLCDKATALLEKLPPENNHIITEWNSLGIHSNSAYDSQAQLQLYNEYCVHKKCLHCNIGHHFLSLQQ